MLCSMITILIPILIIAGQVPTAFVLVVAGDGLQPRLLLFQESRKSFKNRPRQVEAASGGRQGGGG